jgi:uncharacterized Tic20 family protein
MNARHNMPAMNAMNGPDKESIHIATSAQALYLLNILLLPGVAFLGLLWLVSQHRASRSALVQCHLRQALRASICAGVLLVLVSGGIVLLGGFDTPTTWIVLILYVLCMHSAFILMGVVGLTRALAGKLFYYPLIGGQRHAGEALS